MAMVYCRGCAKQLHDSAPACPQCGALQFASSTAAHASGGSAWLAIASLCLGVLCMLALIDDSEWDSDTMLCLGLFASTGLVTGIVSISQKQSGNGMAIAGVIMAAIALLCLIGLSAG